MSNAEFVLPTEGKAVLNLDWKDAEILARIIGMVNTGNLSQYSAVLYDFVSKMNTEVGRNDIDRADAFIAVVRGSQVYVENVFRP